MKKQLELIQEMPGMIGIDVGGTFSDLTFLSPSGDLVILKVPSTPQDQSIGVQNALNQLLMEISRADLDFSFIVHGSTVATNTILERKGSKTALVTTRGFKDILEIGRQTRRSIYDLDVDPNDPLIPRNLRFEIKERLGTTGEILIPVSTEEAEKIVQEMPEDVESIAISFLFSFMNPTHEILVENILKDHCIDLPISRSSKVLPVFREFERTSTTVLDAYVKPIMQKYLKQLRNRVEQIVCRPVDGLRIMKGDGGLVTLVQATERAAETILSGLAGGVLGAVLLYRILNTKQSPDISSISNIISLDIGGTSTDVSLILNGNAMYTRDMSLDGLPLAIPSVDIVTVGAGGGSIAHIGKSGLFQVGPRSAGADPGPACYGTGGTEPTVTDADLLAGKLSPTTFCGGKMSLYPDLSRKAICSLAQKLNISEDDCTSGITRIADTNVVAAVRKISLEKGYDPRRCNLAAFGGAGPTHACEVASLAKIGIVIVPPNPGVWSAVGLLTADHRRIEMKSILLPSEELPVSRLTSEFAELESLVRDFLSKEGFLASQIQFTKEVDARFEGQSYELVIPIPSETLNCPDSQDPIRELFEKEHQRTYGFIAEESYVEIVNIRVTGVCKSPSLRFPRAEKGTSDPSKAFLGEREVLFTEWMETNIYSRYKVKVNNVIRGPAIIEQADSTTVVSPGWKARCDLSGCLILKFENK